MAAPVRAFEDVLAWLHAGLAVAGWTEAELLGLACWYWWARCWLPARREGDG